MTFAHALRGRYTSFRDFSGDSVCHKQKDGVDHGIEQPDRRTVAKVGIRKALPVYKALNHIRSFHCHGIV